MLKNKKLIAITVSVILTLAVATGTTLALLSSFAGPLENVFTIGKVEITLTETTGNDYSMIPGNEITKDPHVTVKGGSESCWLYVSVEKSEGFDDYLSFDMADGWHPLAGHSGIYYRSVERAGGDVEFPILKNDVIVVSSTLTEEKMSEISSAPTLTVKAYAIQSHSIETASDGWLRIAEEVER